MKKITLNVNEEIYEKYQELCRSKDTSVAATIREGMKQSVNAKYVNEKHKQLDIALEEMKGLASIVDEDMANEILELKTRLMIATLDKLN